MSNNVSQTPVPVATTPVPTSVPLSPTTAIDLSWLPEDQRRSLLVEYSRGVLDISKRAQELHVDVAVLHNTLKTLAGTVNEVAKDGNAVTVTHTQKTNIGQTEVIMGNTSQAQSGKISMAQRGAKDWTPYYIIGGLIAVVLIAAFFAA